MLTSKFLALEYLEHSVVSGGPLLPHPPHVVGLLVRTRSILGRDALSVY